MSASRDTGRRLLAAGGPPAHRALGVAEVQSLRSAVVKIVEIARTLPELSPAEVAELFATAFERRSGGGGALQ
jgi:hypothetical protein